MPDEAQPFAAPPASETVGGVLNRFFFTQVTKDFGLYLGQAIFTRYAMPKSGTLRDLSLWFAQNTNNVEIAAGVYDTGQASPGNYTRLFGGTFVAYPVVVGVNNIWTAIGDPNLAVGMGDELIVCVGIRGVPVANGQWTSWVSGTLTDKAPPASFNLRGIPIQQTGKFPLTGAGLTADWPVSFAPAAISVQGHESGVIGQVR